MSLASPRIGVVRLSELDHDREAICFARLVKRDRGTDRNGHSYVKCSFRDRDTVVTAPIWSKDPLLAHVEEWIEGTPYRIHCRAEKNDKFGMQLKIIDIRPAGPEDADDGFDFGDLVETSEYSEEELFDSLGKFIDDGIKDPKLKRLVLNIIEENRELLAQIPAAEMMHHEYHRGLLEHIRSVTRLALIVSKHYEQYYYKLNPPLNRGVIVAAAILHDIGKIREFSYGGMNVTYSKEGSLLGHIVLGRDLVRAAAAKIEGFPEETLLLLEHVILSHHGKLEFGSPKTPQTLEAIVVHYIDDLDSKMNAGARQLMRSKTPDDFTEKVFMLNNQRLYKGVPIDHRNGGEE